MTTTARPLGLAVLLALVLCLSACQSDSGTSAAGPSANRQRLARASLSPTARPTGTTVVPPASGTPSATSSGPATSSETRPASTETPTSTGPTTLRVGMSGPRCSQPSSGSEVGYWLGTPDGTYGDLTAQAVMALQKTEGLHRDGVLGSATRAALGRSARPRARTTSGSAIEVDKERQIVLVVSGGAVRWVLNTSTGSGMPYSSQGHHYVATTPTGRFTVQRQIDGLRISHLGALWRPKYFFEGWALHGSPNVPAYPASHGCVRLSNPAIDLLWSSGCRADRTHGLALLRRAWPSPPGSSSASAPSTEASAANGSPKPENRPGPTALACAVTLAVEHLTEVRQAWAATSVVPPQAPPQPARRATGAGQAGRPRRRDGHQRQRPAPPPGGTVP